VDTQKSPCLSYDSITPKTGCSKNSIEKNGRNKSLVEILAENGRRDGADVASRRQAVFLSLWEEIRDAYNHGWSYRKIWRGLEREGIVDCGYSTFMHYVRKIRRRLAKAEMGSAAPAGGSKTGGNREATAKPPPSVPGVASGSTRVDIPSFGRNVPPRDPKKF
jgi:hypothetical protein